MLPAVGQGALAIEARSDDQRVSGICRVLDDTQAATAVAAERAFLARLGATCRTPVAGYARVESGALTMFGLVGRPDGSELIADRISGSAGDARNLGIALADALLKRGAGAILEANG